MKLNMQISASKETIDYIIEKFISEMGKQHDREQRARERAAKKGWETRRKNAKKKA